MTTGMRTESTVETHKKRNMNWLWFLLAAVIACALVGYAQTPKLAKQDSSAVSGSVQNGATGDQGSVGSFREAVVPNNDQSGKNVNMAPGAQAHGKGIPAGEDLRGTDGGAGLTGISSTQEGLGGATPRHSKGGPVTNNRVSGTDTTPATIP